MRTAMGIIMYQPTLPVRGVTRRNDLVVMRYEFQPTLPVRGVTRRHRLLVPQRMISTHTPRAGSDSAVMAWSTPTFLFQPTLPCGE